MEQEAKTISLDSITEMIQGILSGGTTGNIVKASLIAIIFIGFLLLKRYMKKKEIEATKKRNNERRNQNKTTTQNEAEIISQDAINSEDRIEDILED